MFSHSTLKSPAQIAHHGLAGASTDLTKLRSRIWSYLPKVVLPNGRKIKPLKKKQYLKAGSAYLGFKSLCTTRMHLPIKLRAAFDDSEDPEA